MTIGPMVSGQQLGLLGGPLYTPYKVLGALWHARQENTSAIYWLETNDADFREISVTNYLDKAGNLKSLRWQKETGGLSCGHIIIDEGLITLLEQFFADLTPSEFTPSLRDLALGCYQVGRELGEASVMLAKALFPYEDLRLFDPRDADFRKHSRAILLPLFINTPVGDQCPGFIDENGVRRALYRSADGFALRDGRLVDLADFPLLPNVHTRPLCQDAYFKTAAYIAGPGELAYLLPLADFYRQQGVNQPRLIARMSMTLLEPWSLRVLKALSLEPQDILQQGFETVKQGLIQRKGGLDQKNLEQTVMQLSQTYLQDLQAVHPEFKSLRNPLLTQIKQVLGGIRKSSQEQNVADLERLQKLFMRLKPYDKPQERVFNLFYYMNLYGGLNFVGKLLDNYDPQRSFLEVI